MVKNERQQLILDLLEKNGTIHVNELVKQLQVTDMTIRRDLQELEDQNLLIRIHGGARQVESKLVPFLELSHIEKRNLASEEKHEIARTIADNIKDYDIVFLGSGSTIELVYDYLDINYAKIITNSIHIFDKFKHDERFDLVLTGGTYRSKTGSFTGTIAGDFLSNFYVEKAFIGVNAINDHLVFNANEDEGDIQQLALNNARLKYLVANHQKFDNFDFYQFYDLKTADYLVTDKRIPAELKEKYSKWIEIIN